MKIYIQHSRAKRYFAGHGEWCDDRDCAKCFPNAIRALEQATKLSQPTEIVLVFGGITGEYDIHLNRVRPTRHERQHQGHHHSKSIGKPHLFIEPAPKAAHRKNA